MMRTRYTALVILVMLISVCFVSPAAGDGPPPPPPNHSMNGNQMSPGGTGCPIDRTGGIVTALIVCLGYAGFSLIKKGKITG